MSNLQLSKNLFSKETVQKKFQELLGTRAQGFISSVLQVVNSNDYLAKADPKTIYTSAMMAAALDLPINQNLGFAYIVPYGGREGVQAQFQMGWKGFVQLAQRTGEYKSINAIKIDEGQFVSYNPLTEELKLDFDKEETGKTAGYCARFKLLNGFEKIVYWSKEKVEAHAKKYSQSYERKSSAWQTNFDAMAKKTVLKNALSQYGILSVDMQKAIISDQAVIQDGEENTIDVDYVDNADELTPVLEDLDGAIESIKLGLETVESLQANYIIDEDQLETLNEVKPEKK